jgi:RND family efflux transporter MFP subunit
LGIIDKIYMLAKVAEEKISYVHQNMTAEVLFDSFPNDPLKGIIAKIDPNTDPKTRTFIAYVEIPNRDLKLTPGLTGFTRINYSKNALVVPSIAVINPVGENATVFVVGGDLIAHIKRVKTGLSAGGRTEILEGLKEGDRVAFAGIQALKEGDKVEVIENRL